MYGALWRALPGPAWVRSVLLIVLLAVVLTALVVWVFPYVDSLLIPQEVTVGQ
jgi:hypothetical protein